MSQPKSILVIYHGGCADGFTSAWIARKFLLEDNSIPADAYIEYFPGVYQNPPPDCKDTMVYILDFSYSLDVMQKIVEEAHSVIMCDHHASAFPTFCALKDSWAEDKFGGIFDNSGEYSGAYLTWEWFFPSVPMPKFVQIISDRDVWKFKLPETRNVMANIFSYEYTWENWDRLHEMCGMEIGLNILRDSGAAIERKHHKDIAELVAENKYKCQIDDTEVWVCNLPKTLTSDAGHLMCGEDKTFAACYWDTPEGRVFSLRSRADGMDVSKVAKKFGGGGHKNAAGFRIGYKDIYFDQATCRMVHVMTPDANPDL